MPLLFRSPIADPDPVTGSAIFCAQTCHRAYPLSAPTKLGGTARANLTTASEGDSQSVVQQLFECSDVHASSTGLEMHIAMQSDRVAPAIPGLVSARPSMEKIQL